MTAHAHDHAGHDHSGHDHTGHHHGHGPGGHSHVSASTPTRKLTIALALTVSFMLVEVVTGYLTDFSQRLAVQFSLD